MVEKFWGKKVFVEILTLGEWAPLFLPSFQPYPPLYIPQGVSRGTMLGMAWLGLALIGMAWAIDRAWRMAL